MKLLRAEFQNFRLLRDLELDFSTDHEKRLTVIRAANESGKTTILHGLQWALYGDSALPGKGEGFRLHPIDWDVREGSRVPIVATVEFELTSYRRVLGEIRENRRRFRLVRSAFEEVDAVGRRSPSTVRFFALNATGANPIDAPDALINDELPPELRDVFFTDGDRALSFIEAEVTLSTKRERVQRAIRSLLGLGVIDDAIKHVRKSAAEVNKKAKQVGTGSELQETASRLESINNDGEKLDADLEDAKEQFASFDQRVNDIDKKISAALEKGNKEKLRGDLQQTQREITQLDRQLVAANKEHAALFLSRSIATDLLAPVLRPAFEILGDLHDRGKIPNTTIPVLEDRLCAEICICGEKLQPTDVHGEKRRAHIQKLIDDSQKADEIQEMITDLYYSAKPLQSRVDGGPSEWLEEYKKVVERRDGLQDIREKAGRKFRALENELDLLPDTDVQSLREIRRQYKGQRDRYLSKQAAVETQLAGLQKERQALEVQRDRLLRAQDKGARVLAELEVTQDVLKVLESAYKRITHDELSRAERNQTKGRSKTLPPQPWG